jgi:DHA3 family multidrug efflux protein-like MFS transporter
MRVFHHLLANSLLQNVTNFTVWFALVFWAYLETRSVFVTGVMGGLQMILTAGLAPFLGSLVDHHRKQSVMLASSGASFALYAVALAAYLTVPPDVVGRVGGSGLWLLIVLVMLGVVAGNIRMIALPTLVTALISAERRDRANGLVGVINGIGMVMTSAVSGFLVAWGGMGVVLALAMILSAAAFVHLAPVKLGEPGPADGTARPPRRIDLAGTIEIVTAVPGLLALILFASFNNLLGGVFMALLDAYGLSLMAVQEWGLTWALVSCAFVLSGLVIARMGLGANPLRTLLLVNLVVWAVAALFTVRSSVALLVGGLIVWLFLQPFAEAAEQTTLQKVVPFERQGRVFGFAQAVEQAAAPLTAFIIGPLAEFVVIPFMTFGGGAATIGEWYGTGPERGIALVFSGAGVLGVVAAALALRSRSYRQLSVFYLSARPPATNLEDEPGANGGSA